MTDKANRTERIINSSLTPLWASVSRNWILKLLCLLLAFGTWQGIRESTSYEAVVADVPVSITTGEGRAVLSKSADAVTIRFRGSREDLRFISRDQISLRVHLSGRDRLRQTVKLTPRHVEASAQAHAVQFEPSEITVVMDREVERVLPVKAVFAEDLPEGMLLEKAICSPATVRVKGAEGLLRTLEQVRTVPISLDGRRQSFTLFAPVAAEGRFWSAVPDRVSVEVDLVEQVTTRRIENKTVRPLLASGASRVVQIRPEEVAVALRGTPARMEELDPDSVYAYIDCSELTESTEYEVPVRIDAPAGVKVDQIEPAVVNITVKRM
jgi:YbbR domain-containing protein